MRIPPEAVLISQGAEALQRVYKHQLYENGPFVVLKHRFPKTYRHPTLDVSLTKQRISAESRALVRCLRFGVTAPQVRFVDTEGGTLGLEWIEGVSVRDALGGSSADLAEKASAEKPACDLGEFGLDQSILMGKIGCEIAKLHRADIIHGDLTTSNMMIRRRQGEVSSELVLIDFGLSYNSVMVEDKAVDLYVLERAFASTHPDSEPLFTSVLKAYEDELGEKVWAPIFRRLEDVRLRGRKRSMVG